MLYTLPRPAAQSRSRRLSKLAVALLEGNARKPRLAPSGSRETCHACGKSFEYCNPRGDNSGRFCSDRCLAEYEIPGAFTFNPFGVTRGRVVAGGDPGYLVTTPMTAAATGFRVACRGCGKQFESRGWAFCRHACKRRHYDRQGAEAAVAEIGMELIRPKRPCQAPGCNHRIPVWRKGRLVSEATRFCSAKCARKARSLQGVFVAQTAKKYPILLSPKSHPRKGSVSGIGPSEFPRNIVGGYRPSRSSSASPASSSAAVEPTPEGAADHTDPWAIPDFLRRDPDRSAPAPVTSSTGSHSND